MTKRKNTAKLKIVATPADVTSAQKATSAKKPGKPAKAKPNAEGVAKKLSAIDAVAKVLGETGQAMTCKELIDAMAAKGYWISPGGKTPHATLYSAILREVANKGDQARFTRAERGKFAAKV